MKTIDFIFIGTAKDKAYQKLETEYHTRIKRYGSSHITILKDVSEKNRVIKNKKETEAILEKTKPGDFVVVCDEKGTSFDTKTFSQKISEWKTGFQRVVFVIGGPYGFDKSIEQKTNLKLRLSDMTLPHEMARVILLEQVYRSLTILNNEKYHH